MLLLGRKETALHGQNKTTKKKTKGVGPERNGAAKRQARVVNTLLKKVEQKLSEDEVKATLGDYIRLVQLQKELEEDEPREIKVTWVEPETTESDSGK